MSDPNFDLFALPVQALATDEVVFTDPDCSLEQCAKHMTEAGVGLLVLGSKDSVVGVVSERDIVSAVAAGLDLAATHPTVQGPEELLWTAPESTVGHVSRMMMQKYVRHVLVTDASGDGIGGVVSARDLLVAIPS